jgi:putative hydrolase of the HAD superfamily
MGGVLVRLAPLDATFGLDGAAAETFWPRWLASGAVRAFESGNSSAEEFAAGVVADLELDLTPAEALERFRLFPQGLFPGAADLVRSLPDGVITGVLSNTNALHWEGQIDHEVVQNLCHHAFLSYRLGLLKPDRDCYEAVLAELDCPAQQVLFIDDNAINVDGAKAVGMRAEVAKGPQEAAQVLARYGLPTP